MYGIPVRFISCNGLAAFQDLGLVENGFELIHRTGTLDFGDPLAQANRHLLGDDWDSKFSNDEAEWFKPKERVELLAGLPPCSGWSCWTGPANRGPDSKAHEHTRAFMRYAGIIKPQVAIFECVGQAFTQGRDVMLKYREMVEEISGKQYDLHHVKMNNLMIGGFSYRPRYFWVAVEKGMPFSAEVEWPEQIPTIIDVIGDLADLPETWDKQPYQAPASEYVHPLLSRSGLVDGHQGKTNIHATRIKEVLAALEEAGAPWAWGEGLSFALKRVHDYYGKLPESWEAKSEKIVARKFDMGFSLPYRWAGDSWANVLTGGCLDMVVHPTRDRCLTHREAARIQGLPDDWVISPVKQYTPMADAWGKAVSHHAGRWIGVQAKRALNGEVTTSTGVEIGDREWLHETDKGFSRQRVRARYLPGTKGGITRAYNPELWPQGAPVQVSVDA